MMFPIYRHQMLWPLVKELQDDAGYFSKSSWNNITTSKEKNPILFIFLSINCYIKLNITVKYMIFIDDSNSLK